MAKLIPYGEHKFGELFYHNQYKQQKVLIPNDHFSSLEIVPSLLPWNKFTILNK